MKDKWPFQIRFLLLNLLFLFPLILLGQGFYSQTFHIMEENLYVQTQDILSTQVLFLNRYLEGYQKSAEEVLFQTGLIDTLGLQYQGEPYWLREDLQAELRNIFNRYGTIFYLALDAQGRHEMLNRSINTDREMPFHLQMEQARERFISSDEGVHWGFFETDRSFLYYHRDIYSLDMARRLGSMEIVFDISYVLEEMDYLLGRFEPYFVMGEEQSGQVLRITHTNWPEGVEDYLSFHEKALSGVFRDRGRRRTISYRSLTRQNWRLMLVLPDEDFFSPLRKVRFLAMAVFVLFLLFCGFLLFWVNRNITRPLNVLSRGILQFEKKPEAQELPRGKRDEFGRLLEQFNQMSRELDRYINRDLKEQLRVKEAELKALQAQIKPHFLFNTLETIHWMALMENQKEISEMILSLSSLLDAGLGRNSGEYPLIEEITHLEKYIYLYQKRFEGTILFDYRIPEELQNYPIPPLLLQPLIENSLAHNRMIKREELHLSIEACRRGRFLVICCKDDGQGMEESERKKLNRAFREQRLNWQQAGEGGKSSHVSIGMTNVNLRIKLFYGLEYGLFIKAKKEEGADILLLLPGRMEDV